MKLRVGNKQNSILNGEWAGHVRKYGKKITSGKRRMKDKELIKSIKDNIEIEMKVKKIYTQEEISKTINNFKRKYQDGFMMSEIKELLSNFEDINIDKFDAQMSGITVLSIDNNILIYPHDVFKGIINGLEYRDILINKFD